MAVTRRAAIAAFFTAPAVAAESPSPSPSTGPMYGLIGKMRAQPGQRDTASYKASLDLPSVRAAVGKGRPLIAGFGERFETRPVAGPG